MAYVMMSTIGGYTASQVSGLTVPSDSGGGGQDIRGDAFIVLGNTPATNTESGTRKTWTWTNNVTIEVDIAYGGSNNRGFILDTTTTPPGNFGGWAGLAYSSLKADFVYFIDEENQLAAACFCARLNGIDFTHVAGWTPPANRHTLYERIKGIEPILYTWKSVPAVSGKNGVLSLSMINDADIGTGSPVPMSEGKTSAVLSNVISASSMRSLTANMFYGETRELIWSGDNYKATLKYMSAQCQISFFLQQTTPGTWSAFYSYTFDDHTDVNGNIDTYLGFIIDDENEVAALNIIDVYRNITGQPTGTVVAYNNPGTTMSVEDMHLLWGWLRGSFLDNDPLDGFTDNEGDGGGELVNRVNNPIPTPGLPYSTALNTGFVSEYVIGKTELNNLAKFLWSDNFVNTVKKFFNDPMEILIGLMIFPQAPNSEVLGTSREIKGGGITTGVFGTPLTSQWDSFDFGSCVIERRLKKTSEGQLESQIESGGIYFDYSPYTECKIYLPYVGEHSLDLNDVMGRTLKLKYSVDYMTGTCCAHLTLVNNDDPDTPEECHYNFTGQMGVAVPISQADYRQKMSAMISAGLGIGTAIATIASGGLTAPIAGAAAYKVAGVNPGPNMRVGGNALALGMGTGSRLANNVANMHPTVQHTSGGGSISGSLSSEYPYVTISEPDVFQAENQPHYKGYPINATHKIGDFNGYVQIENIHLDGLSCTENERESIMSYLQGGVIVNQIDPSETPEHSAPSGELAVVFLKNSSDPETIGKKWSDANKVTGKLLYNNDIENIKLLVHGNFTAYNYCYIHELGRYYYINTFIIEKDGDFTVDMSVDVLQSFKDEILEIPALIDSAEDKSKAKFLMNNGYWYMKQNKVIKTLMFKKSGQPAKFNRDSSNEVFLLTIAGDTLD